MDAVAALGEGYLWFIVEVLETYRTYGFVPPYGNVRFLAVRLSIGWKGVHVKQ